MRYPMFVLVASILTLHAGSGTRPIGAAEKALLPSWTAGPTRSAIIEFVEAVTREGGPDYVPPAERIATFDNDGTLWVEYPIYTQLLFAVDRVKELASQHPEWKSQQPFKAVLEGDRKAVAATGMKGLMEIVVATHSGMSEEAFAAQAGEWLRTKRHPRFQRPFAECVYQPMIELLSYLRENEFSTYIVSGGGVSFMRPITQTAYGIPPEQVVGSRVATEYQVKDGKGMVVRLPKIDFIDDKAGKPVGIQTLIGRRPILACGNSDGDFEMLEYTTTGNGRCLGILIHHTDGDREFAYDRESHVGKLSRGLDQAATRGWVIADMKRDWKRIFAEKSRKVLQ